MRENTSKGRPLLSAKDLERPLLAQINGYIYYFSMILLPLALAGDVIYFFRYNKSEGLTYLFKNLATTGFGLSAVVFILLAATAGIQIWRLHHGFLEEIPPYISADDSKDSECKDTVSVLLASFHQLTPGEIKRYNENLAEASRQESLKKYYHRIRNALIPVILFICLYLFF